MNEDFPFETSFEKYYGKTIDLKLFKLICLNKMGRNPNSPFNLSESSNNRVQFAFLASLFTPFDLMDLYSFNIEHISRFFKQCVIIVDTPNGYELYFEKDKVLKIMHDNSHEEVIQRIILEKLCGKLN